MLRGTFQPDVLTGERYFRWRGGDVSRLEALSDAVFALALTLLVVRLDVPQTFAEVKYAFVHAPVYLACFALFVWIWFCHHQFHRRYGLEGPLTVALDAAILFTVLLLALPLRFVAELLYAQIRHGSIEVRGFDGEVVRAADGAPLPMLEWANGELLMTFYAGGFALLFLLFVVQTYTAYRLADALQLDAVERRVTRNTLRMHAATLGIAVLSIALLYLPGASGRSSGLVFFLMGPVHGLLGYFHGRGVHRLAVEEGIVGPRASGPGGR